MTTVTLTLTQLEAISVAAFFCGVGVAYVCHAIIRAALYAPLADLDLEQEPADQPAPAQAPIRRVRRAARPRRRFATTPIPVPALTPAQWARRSFDDPRAVRLLVQIGAST